jgi:hypothetical protein
VDDSELKRHIEKLKATMIAVSTGGPRIDDVNFEFGETWDRVSSSLAHRGVDNPFPYRDLWEWYGRWSEDLPSWASRRKFVAELAAPLLRQISNPAAPVEAESGWARVDRTVGKARESLARALSEEDYQAVGLLCRETLISLGQEVFEPSRHPTIDDQMPSATDFKRQIEAYLEAELTGSARKEARRHARSALDLASQLLHQRTAQFRDAAICLEATASVINIVAIASGRRDPA